MATISNPLRNGLPHGRKRQLSEDEDMGDAYPLSVCPQEGASGRRHFDQHRHSLRGNADVLDHVKRSKSGIQKRTAMANKLVSLDKEKLIDIIQTLLNAHPEIQQDIIERIPAPTIASAISVINSIEKRATESFPYNRHGPSRNDYTFSRVRGPLIELVETVLQYAAHFTSHLVFPSTRFAFLDVATHVAHRLPLWENKENNRLKHDLYEALNDYWRKAIERTASNLKEGETYSHQIVSEWAKNLAQHNSYTGGIFNDAVHEFSRRLGFMLGLSHNEVLHDAPACHHPVAESKLARLTSPSRVVGYDDLRR